jgi:chromosome condensin MukBEF ATPase and DNA-binding subunit MukB
MASMALLWLVAPAQAQFEISPDHLDETAAIAGQSGLKQQELQTKIDEQQKTLQDLNAQIDQQAKVTESARETAIGAGAVGDAASIFIDEYVRQFSQLEQLKKELAPRISQAKQTLAALQAEQFALSAQPEPTRQPVNSTHRRTVAARKKPVIAPTATLQANR